jgi:hypothetical protein
MQLFLQKNYAVHRANPQAAARASAMIGTATGRLFRATRRARR